MKFKRLLIKNIGMVKNSIIPIDRPLVIFFGQPMEGKTTHLNAVRWAFGGAFPDDIITHGEKDGSITLEFDSGTIIREFYRAKDGTTAARPISFVRDGKPVKKPVDEIKKFLNPFLLDQDYLRKMTELERSRYFVELFGVDTSALDKEISASEQEARELRIKIKMYGDIDTKEIKPIDVAPLVASLNDKKRAYQIQVNEAEDKNKVVRFHNENVNAVVKKTFDRSTMIDDLELQIKNLKAEQTKDETWIQSNPKQDEIPYPAPPDTSSLESQISDAAATNVRAEQYQANLKRARVKQADGSKLVELESQQRDLKKAKIAKLKDISDNCKIKGLSFDETGNFSFEGTSAGMLSGSQIMRLSEELSSLYPKDLGISLIDRGESLGKSIFLLIDRAKEDEKTILATVVGERPANVPEEVGVWVVEKGEVK